MNRDREIGGQHLTNEKYIFSHFWSGYLNFRQKFEFRVVTGRSPSNKPIFIPRADTLKFCEKEVSLHDGCGLRLQQQSMNSEQAHALSTNKTPAVERRRMTGCHLPY